MIILGKRNFGIIPFGSMEIRNVKEKKKNMVLKEKKKNILMEENRMALMGTMFVQNGAVRFRY